VTIVGDRDLAERLGRVNRNRSEQISTVQQMDPSYQHLWEQILAASH
jgi:hypothetical protein